MSFQLEEKGDGEYLKISLDVSELKVNNEEAFKQLELEWYKKAAEQCPNGFTGEPQQWLQVDTAYRGKHSSLIGVNGTYICASST